MGAATADILRYQPVFSTTGVLFAWLQSLWLCPFVPAILLAIVTDVLAVFSNDPARTPGDAPYQASRCMISISRYIQYRSSDPTCWQGRLSLKHYESPLERPNEQLSNLGPRCQHYTNVSLIAVGHHLSRILQQELVERISVTEDSELTRKTLVVLW